jgi:hypothetical protein
VRLPDFLYARFRPLRFDEPEPVGPAGRRNKKAANQDPWCGLSDCSPVLNGITRA